MSFVLTNGIDDEDATEFAYVACAYACVAIENQALVYQGKKSVLPSLPFFYLRASSYNSSNVVDSCACFVWLVSSTGTPNTAQFY